MVCTIHKVALKFRCIKFHHCLAGVDGMQVEELWSAWRWHLGSNQVCFLYWSFGVRVRPPSFLTSLRVLLTELNYLSELCWWIGACMHTLCVDGCILRNRFPTAALFLRKFLPLCRRVIVTVKKRGGGGGGGASEYNAAITSYFTISFMCLT